MDKREKRAQSLLWEVQALRAAGNVEEAAKKSRSMAKLHEELADERLGARDPRGWIHLQAAATAWAKAGRDDDFARAFRLLAKGIDLSLSGRLKNHDVLNELFRLCDWARSRQPKEPAPAERSTKRRAVA